MKSIRSFILFGLIASILGVAVSHHFYKARGAASDLSHFQGTYLPEPRQVNSFELVGTDNKPFTQDGLKGQWTFVFFGFTECSSLCPTTLTELAKMERLLGNSSTSLPKVVMISLDPKRDSIERLKKYVQAFHPDFYGARGEEAVIQSMTREMGIAYAKIKAKQGEDPKQYQLQHSGVILLFNPDGHLNAFFTTPYQAKSLAEDYVLLTKAYQDKATKR
jgi:protein SCO1/2